MGSEHLQEGSSAAGKAGRPNETVDTLEMAFCPATGRLTMTVATDMLVQNGGPTVQAVRMWVKQWTFTAAQGRHAATAGCTVGTAFYLS